MPDRPENFDPRAAADDFESPDAAELDLTPRPVSLSPAPRRRIWWGAAALALSAGGAAFVLTRGLGDATLFFRNVDEAVAERAKLGDRRFRMQGTVAPGSLKKRADGVSFELEFGGVSASVRHRGDPPDLFREGMPVVIEGSWSGDVFVSDRMMVKHSEVYVAEHPDRLQKARSERAS